ncbi:unnamed protein product [Candidula unifasciata]|uniref:Secreted protein n=1 Tax=Candidula unifasciata TaxID=100452 RepID=A0A8S3ZFZ5_9EUPU|nr:unnamed protein product [Candidula unifasciata]
MMATACLLATVYPVNALSIWTDVLSCVNKLANDTTPLSPSSGNVSQTSDTEPAMVDFSMMKLFSVICGNKDMFVTCLDTSLKKSNDSMTQIIGSFFDPALVTKAYVGLCANISEIEQAGVDALSCLSTVKMTSCQLEMADYFFYMGVVKQFAPPSEQLSSKTMETLLCSMTFKRRRCEVLALQKCNENLANVMEEFYRQTQPTSCAALEKDIEQITDNHI